MELLQIIVLALVQGLTEFLPVSSSAHLILVPLLTEWCDQGLSFDIAVHVGTLFAVILYFYKELIEILREWSTHLFVKEQTDNSRLGWAILWGTIPAGMVGIFGKDLIETYLRSPLAIATTTIVFGVLLGVVYFYCKGSRSEYSLRLKDILFIGAAQALALIPGTSRSGITITAGLMVGLSPESAARFSFLLSIPIILASGALLMLDLFAEQQVLDWTSLILGAVLSALSAYACIHFFLKLLKRIGMMPFVIYRVILGCILLAFFV